MEPGNGDPEERYDAIARRILTAAWSLLTASFGSNGDVDTARTDVKLLEQIKPSDVVRRANLSTGAFYKRWPDREAFVDDLLDFSLATERSRSLEKTLSVARREEERGSSLRDTIEAISRADLENVVDDPAFMVQMYLWSSCRSKPEIRARLQNLYGELTLARLDLYCSVLRQFDLEVREPFRMEDVDAVLTAVVEGLAIQRVIGRDLPDDIVTWTLLALVLVLARPSGDSRTLFDLWDAADTANTPDLSPPNDAASLLRTESFAAALNARRRAVRALISELSSLDAELGELVNQSA